MATAIASHEVQLLRVDDVAKRLSVSRSKVYAMMDAGELQFVKLGKSRRVPVEAVDNLIRESTVNSR